MPKDQTKSKTKISKQKPKWLINRDDYHHNSGGFELRWEGGNDNKLSFLKEKRIDWLWAVLPTLWVLSKGGKGEVTAS